MDCPKCGIEMRVNSKKAEYGLEQEFSCRNPQCEGYGAVQATVQIRKEETEHA